MQRFVGTDGHFHGAEAVRGADRTLRGAITRRAGRILPEGDVPDVARRRGRACGAAKRKPHAEVSLQHGEFRVISGGCLWIS